MIVTTIVNIEPHEIPEAIAKYGDKISDLQKYHMEKHRAEWKITMIEGRSNAAITLVKLRDAS